MRRSKAVCFLLAMWIVVALGGTTLASTVFNGDFETLVPGVSSKQALDLAPYGWVATGYGDAWSVGLTDKEVFDGDYAMEIIVHPENTVGGLHVASRPIPVEAGKTYTAAMKVFNDQSEPPYTGRVDLYVEFWPDGGWWGDVDYWSAENTIKKAPGGWKAHTRIVTTPIMVASPTGLWRDLSLTVTAPEGAKYVTISLWSSLRVLRTYIDNVRLTVE